MTHEAMERYERALARAEVMLADESPAPGGMSPLGEAVQRGVVTAWLDLTEPRPDSDLPVGSIVDIEA